MNQKNYTSFKFSKWLSENGCELESEYYRNRQGKLTEHAQGSSHCGGKYETADIVSYCPAYDLLWDICCKYPKEFFGDSPTDIYYHCNIIIQKLQQNKKDEVENYIWKNCLFNPKNK